MLTRRTTYGIRALARMASRPGQATSVAELAALDGIPLHFLSLILGELRQRGIVRALRGSDGGYELAVDPAALTIAEVVECLGGPLFPFPCLLPRAAVGSARRPIRVRRSERSPKRALLRKVSFSVRRSARLRAPSLLMMMKSSCAVRHQFVSARARQKVESRPASPLGLARRAMHAKR